MFFKQIESTIQDELSAQVAEPGTIKSAAGPESLSQFARWLLAAGEDGPIFRSHLRALYAEFALYTDSLQLSDGRLFRGLKAAGISRHREGSGKRRWFYRVRACGDRVTSAPAGVRPDRDQNEHVCRDLAA